MTETPTVAELMDTIRQLQSQVQQLIQRVQELLITWLVNVVFCATGRPRASNFYRC